MIEHIMRAVMGFAQRLVVLDAGRKIADGVITSYSIHYTKLYDWHEYGMRVGFWRFVHVLASAQITPTMAVNGSVLKSYPRIAEAARDARWEFMGHGYVQRPMHHVEDQRQAIRDTVEARITSYNVCYTKLLRVGRIQES